MAEEFESFISLLGDDFSVRWLITLLHFVWQGALVGGGVAIAGRLLRGASARRRYALYSAALLGLPICVAVTFCVVEVPAGLRSQSPSESLSDTPAAPSALPSQDTATTAVFPSETAEATQGPLLSERVVGDVSTMTGDVDDASASLPHALLPVLSRAAPWVAVAYFVGVACFLLRLSTALWGGHRLRNSTIRVADAKLLKLISDQAAQVRLKCVPVVAYCERVAVPVVVGVLRPIVLLPVPLMTGLTPDDFAVIIRHELAHIRRHDLWMNLLQRVIESLLFFHPAVWFVSRQLSAEREVCCDDLVVSSGYEPAHYAGALLRMAELCAISRQPDTVALAATGDKRPMLERRIERLLNGGNAPRLQLTRAGMASLLITFLSLIAVPGIAHTWAQARAQEVAQPPADDGGSPVRNVAAADVNAPPTRVVRNELPETALRGVVLGPRREPFQNAQIWISNLGLDSKQWTRRPQPKVTWTRTTESDAAGRFEATLDPAIVGRAVGGQSNILIAATAEGFGGDWVDVDVTALTEEVSLQLVNDQPIEGQIVTLEGEPAVGVSVEISTLPYDVPDVERDVIKSAQLSSGVYTNWPARRGGPPLSEPMVTDAKGRFHLNGMGMDRYVRLEAFGSGMRATRLKIFTHPTPNERLPGGVIAVREGLPESEYFARFIHVAAPSRTIQGVVRDEENGEPIEGVHVTAASSWKLRAEPAVTDTEGRFELTHLPQMATYKLTFDPSKTYHCNKLLVPSATTGTAPMEQIVSLHRGIVARGRLTDPVTGTPIQATLEYNPLFPNENWRKLGEERVANPASTTTTDEDGLWELAVLPGPGAIAATTRNGRYAEARVRRDELESLADNMDVHGDQPELRFLQPAAGDQRRGIMGLGNAVALINPDSQTTRLGVDLELVVGRSRRVTTVDPSGDPVSGVQAIGLGNLAPQESANLNVGGLVPGRRKQLLFLHRKRNLGAVLEVTGDELTPLTVQLAPTGTLTGRLVDDLGAPLPNAFVSLAVIAPDGTLLGASPWGSSVDEDGRFRIDTVIAICKYAASISVPEHQWQLHIPGTVEVKSGESRNLGEFTKQNAHRFIRTSREHPSKE